MVIAVIALLLALLVPALRAAREQAHRAICLSNLRQLTLAWQTYAHEYDGCLPYASAFGTRGQRAGIGGWRWVRGWLGRAFLEGDDRAAILEHPDKGSLWPYIGDVDFYRCPNGTPGHLATYGIVSGANGSAMEGTYVQDVRDHGTLSNMGKRVGGTILYLTRLEQITRPGPAQRAVFIDSGQAIVADFCVHYLRSLWHWAYLPPIRHAKGTTLSFADGHAEYWKWRGRETLEIPRELLRGYGGLFCEVLAEEVRTRPDGTPGYEPQTEDGLYDLQCVQRATWGRLGYGQESP